MNTSIQTILLLFLLAAIMGLMSLKVDWVITLYTRVYGFLGINVDFTGRGQSLIRFLFGLMALILLIAGLYVLIAS